MARSNAKMLFGFNLLVLFLVFGQCKLDSSVKIDVTTQYHDGVIPNAFNIRCVPQTHGNCAKSVISIQLTKDDDKNIVNLQRGDFLTYNPLLESSLQAEGHIDQDLTKTYLSVTIKEAVKEDSGLYTCKLLFLDEALQFRFVTASDNVTVTNQDTQDIIKHLMSKISFLENLVQFQQNELSNVKTNLVSQGTELQGLKTNLVSQGTELQDVKTNLVSQGTELQGVKTVLVDQEAQLQSNSNKANQSVMDLGEKVTTLETELIVQKANNEKQKTHFHVELQEQKTHFDVELQEQKTMLTNQIQTLDQHLAVLSDKDKTTVSFTALHTGTGVFRYGQDLIYGSVVENVGGAYNGQTGVFTAPYTGYYLLQVSLCAIKHKWIDVDLKSSQGQVLARLAAYDDTHPDFADTSIVARLEAGVEVKPVIRAVTAGFTLYKHYSPDAINKYNGYLLKML